VLRAWRVDGDTVVEVEDTGPGMDEATLVRIFEPFRQDGSAASSRAAVNGRRPGR
jgi:signal transduction histidine kinase